GSFKVLPWIRPRSLGVPSSVRFVSRDSSAFGAGAAVRSLASAQKPMPAQVACCTKARRLRFVMACELLQQVGASLRFAEIRSEQARRGLPWAPVNRHKQTHQKWTLFRSSDVNVTFSARMNRNGQKRMILAPFGYFSHFRGKGANTHLAARVVCGFGTGIYVAKDCRKWFV